MRDARGSKAPGGMPHGAAQAAARLQREAVLRQALKELTELLTDRVGGPR